MRSAPWKELEREIRATPAQTIIILWQGTGGYDYIGHDFENSMKSSGKRIIIRIVGGSYSMHAVVPCFASEVEFQRGFMMYHLTTNGYNDQPDLTSNGRRDNEEQMGQCYRKGLVTRQDINDVNRDNEVWVYPDHSRVVLPDRRR